MMNEDVNIATREEPSVPPLVTTTQLAAAYGVDPSAIRRWVESKKVTPAIITPGGHYRFDPEAVERELRRARRRSGRAA